MKKFKTPLAIKGTEEQLEALIPQLEVLGYIWVAANRHDYSSEYYCLITDYDKLGGLGFYYAQARLQVSATNPELVLALAAMIEGDTKFIGEYLYMDGYITTGCKNRLQKIIKIRKRDGWVQMEIDGESNHWNPNHSEIRKATVQEILNHFNQPNMATNEQALKQPEKKIIGYKVKEGINKVAVAKALDHSDPEVAFNKYRGEDWEISFKSPIAEIAKNRGLLELVFEPVYEQQKKIIKVKHRDGELEVEIKDGKAYCEGLSWYRNDLQSLFCKMLTGRGSFIPESFTAGCNSQYKGITREEIQKVIDGLS